MDALVLVRSQAKPHANSCQFGSSMELVLDTCLDLAAPAQTHSIDLSAANADHDHEPNQNTGGIRLTRALDGVYAVHGVSVYSVLDTVAEKMCEIDDIRCLVTSPCLELVVVATPTATLLLTHALMQIATLDSDRAPESDALGWGSAKTQFKGKKNQEVVLNAGVGVASVDDGMPRVAWRGDGKYFAVSTFESNRRILVYSRQGVLVHAAEPIPGLGQALCWKPAGDLFASAQKLAHVHRVVFYELNGLRHGGFDLQNPESRVLEMAFSCDSSILALLLEIPTTDRAGVQITRSVIQLWTSSNYAWYLAYELAPQTPSTTFTSFLWHPESPLVLVTTESAQYMTLQHEFVRHVFASTATGTSNRGVVGVVNGKNADFTPFRDRNVPPPMKWGASVHKSNVLYIAFGPGPLPKPNAEIGESVDVAVLLADMSVDFYGGVQTRAPVFLFSIDSLQTSSFTARQILWVRPGVLIALGFDSHEQRDKLFVVTFAQQDKCTTANILHRVEVELPEDLMLIHHDENSGGVMVETVSGSILVLEEASSDKDADGTRPDNNGMWTLEFHCQFATPCIKIATLFVGHASNNSRENRLFACVGLTDRNKLYVDSHVLSQDCTSFYVHDTHLIVSTLEHVARFYPTTVTSILDFIRPISDSARVQLTRKIEQGARIITAIGTETGLVLQMPRGNLETISPRPLVLAKITHALAKLEYDVAFMLCRRHRVDLNLLVDYDFETFMSSIAKFVVLVANPSYLNLFVTALVDGNVAISMYNISPQGATMPSDKVNTICCALRRELEASHDTTKYLETILTTECKQSPPLLESAMARIYALHTHGQSALADRSLAYLIFLADGDVLYDLALGTYDFQLVVMVAKQTDRDPREYMPFLAHLQTLDEDYMRYSVDVHLRHMDDALRNLAKSKGRFDELVKFVEDNDMYVNALELFEKTSDEYRQLASVFAQHLETESLFNQAGVMHEQSGTADSVEEAVRCYMLAGEWTAGYMIMLRNQFSVASIAENAHSCADNLFRDRRFKDAAIIFEQVVGAYDRAAECLVHAGDFPAAYMLKAKHALAIDVDAGLLATCTEYTADLESQLVSFEAQLKRLAQVGEKKLQFNIVMRNARMHGGALDGIDMLEDTASMATTATGQSASSLASQSSGLTGKSGRTGKQRRKMARRRASGKDPAFEDEYLVTKMKVQMEKIDAEQKMVTELLKWLVRIDRRRAQALQTAYGNVVAMHVYHMNVVFAPLVQVELQNDDEDQNADANSPKVATVINRPILTTGKWWLDILRPPPPADFTLKV